MKFLEFNPTFKHMVTLGGEITALTMLLFIEEYPGFTMLMFWELYVTSIVAKQMWQESRNQT